MSKYRGNEIRVPWAIVGSEESLYDGRNKKANWKVKAREMVGERRRESL